MPAAVLVGMTPKGSMTSQMFITFLQYLAEHKPAGRTDIN